MKTMILWILHHFMFAGTKFAAAPVDLGGLDAPVDTPTDAPADDPQPEAEASSSGDDPAAPVDAEPAPEVVLDQRAMPVAVKDAIKNLQTLNPKAAGWLKDELGANRAFRQEFPGGMKEARELKASVDNFKTEFPDGIEGIKAEKTQWAEIDAAWANKDPKVLDVWMKSSPEAFSALVPQAMNKLASSNPEAYQHHMAKVIDATLQQSNVASSLFMMERALAMKDYASVDALVKGIQEWVSGIGQTAKKAPEAKPANPQIDQREAQLAEREHAQWTNETAGPINSAKTAAIRKEMAQYAKGTELDADTFDAFQNQVHVYLDQLLKADPQFIPTFEKYMAAKDRAGITSFMQSKVEQLLPSRNGKPGPVERAWKLFNRGASPKPSVKAAARPVGASPAAQPSQGWTKVAAAPQPHEMARIDQFENVARYKAATLANGKKVYWGAQPPPA